MSKLSNLGTRVDSRIAIQRHFERMTYLERQRPQTSRTPDVIACVKPSGDMALMSYPQVVDQRIKVIRHPLNFNHLFDGSQIIDVELPAIPPGLSVTGTITWQQRTTYASVP